jgi:restriction endonuclease S subunit
MITYSIIKKSQLEGALRLDAEYYQPEYLEVLEKIKKLPHKKLGDLCLKITDGSHQTPPYQESGMPFLMVKDVLEQQINFDQDISFISEDFDKKLKHCKPGAGDILLTKVGSVGISAVVPDDAPSFNIFVSIAVIKNCGGIDKFFLSTFLNSKFGRIQAIRAAKGISQPDLHLEDIKEFLIPIFPKDQQKEISKLVIEAINLFKDSKSLYSQAEDLLLEELGLKNFKIEDDLFYIVNLSEIKSSHRADAEYFQPKYERLISRIKYKIEKLNNLLLPKGGIKKGIEIGSEQYQEEGKLFIRVSNLSKHGLVERDQKYLTEELYQKLKKDFEPKVGEILLTKDATPGIAYLLKESIEGIIAGGILRLKVKPDINPEYLVLVINSIVGQMQIEKDTGGSVIFHWRPDQIKNLLIPILPKPIQQKIADLVQKSHEVRKKAKQLLEEAKRKVEELIE